MNILKAIFSDPGFAGLIGMILFGGMFITIGWMAVSSKHQKQK